MAVEQSGPAEQSARASPSRATAKPDPDAASETSSVHSGDPSDRRDADIVLHTQILSTRSEEYRLLFRLPPDEVLVQDFNCALQENILLLGHMYLFIHHVCFYSNIFGFETKKTIPFHEVTCVRKAKTAAIFPNAIEIVAGGKKYFFGSFLSRDEAHRLIIDGWAQHSSESKPFLDCQEAKSDANTQDNPLVMLERLRESKRSSDALSSSDRSKDANILEQCKHLSNGGNDVNTSKKLSEVQDNRGENGDSLSPGEPLTWLLEDVDAPKIPEYFTVIAETKFPVRVEDFFSLFISDCASEFLKNFHRRCGHKDFRCTPWRKHEQFGHARDLSFLHHVKLYIGAKFGHCQEVQKFRVFRNSHLVIETSQEVSDVPYGDYFHVEGIWDVEQDGDEDNGCVLRLYSNVVFSKKSMFKGKIEQSTRDGCREAYGIWINTACELLKQKNAGQPEGLDSQNTIMFQDNFVESESSLKLEGPSEKLHPMMTSSETPQILPNTNNFNTQINNPPLLRYSLSLASTFRESWDTFVSYLKSLRHFSLFLVVAFTAIVILNQVSIVVLLTRIPEVHVVTQGNYVSSPVHYTLENIEWLEKRFNYLKEEMLTVETRMERMRHEYAMLKAHLQSLERLKPKS